MAIIPFLLLLSLSLFFLYQTIFFVFRSYRYRYIPLLCLLAQNLVMSYHQNQRQQSNPTITPLHSTISQKNYQNQVSYLTAYFLPPFLVFPKIPIFQLIFFEGQGFPFSVFFNLIISACQIVPKFLFDSFRETFYLPRGSSFCPFQLIFGILQAVFLGFKFKCFFIFLFLNLYLYLYSQQQQPFTFYTQPMILVYFLQELIITISPFYPFYLFYGIYFFFL